MHAPDQQKQLRANSRKTNKHEFETSASVRLCGVGVLSYCHPRKNITVSV